MKNGWVTGKKHVPTTRLDGGRRRKPRGEHHSARPLRAGPGLWEQSLPFTPAPPSPTADRGAGEDVRARAVCCSMSHPGKARHAYHLVWKLLLRFGFCRLQEGSRHHTVPCGGTLWYQ